MKIKINFHRVVTITLGLKRPGTLITLPRAYALARHSLGLGISLAVAVWIMMASALPCEARGSTYLGNPLGPNDPNKGAVIDISNDGTALIGIFQDNNFVYHGWRWTPSTGYIWFAHPVTGEPLWPSRISRDGRVVIGIRQGESSS